MKKYDTYKESSIEWIGKIPSHWNIKKFKYLFKLVSDKNNKELPKVGLENIESWTGKYINTGTEFEGDGEVFLPKDILFGKLRPYLAKVYLAEFTGKAVGDIFVFRTGNEINAEYGSHLLLSKSFIDLMTSSTFGAKMPRVSWEFIGNQFSPIPSIHEQTTIASYLDLKTTEIDNLIADKKRLLELYGEEKTSFINKVVTKGINPDVKYKDSGIEWLGEIPEHWEVKKVKHVLRSLNNIRIPLSADERGKMANRIYDYYGASGIIDKVEDYLFDEPLLLIGEDGANLLTRSTRLSFIAKGKYWVNNHAHILKPKYGSLEYYCELLELCDYSIWITGSAQPKLTSENLANINIIVPPISEQQSIVNFIESEIAQIDTKISKTEKLIELLTEYRTALISEVVTGKIKVID